MWRDGLGLSQTALRFVLVACVFVCLLLAVVAAPSALAQDAADEADEPALALAVSDERPVRGSTVRITATRGPGPAPGTRVTAVYRPNSTTSVTEELAAVDSSGTLMWTPLHTGPVTLEARPAEAGEGDAAAASYTLAVRYGTFPPSGMLIMVLAGLLLFGGAAVALYLLLTAPEQIPAAEPPST